MKIEQRGVINKADKKHNLLVVTLAGYVDNKLGYHLIPTTVAGHSSIGHNLFRVLHYFELQVTVHTNELKVGMKN